MEAPSIKLAVRDATGKSHLFILQHEEIQSHEQAMALTSNEFPGAGVVLALVPKGSVN